MNRRVESGQSESGDELQFDPTSSQKQNTMETGNIGGGSDFTTGVNCSEGHRKWISIFHWANPFILTH